MSAGTAAVSVTGDGFTYKVTAGRVDLDTTRARHIIAELTFPFPGNWDSEPTIYVFGEDPEDPGTFIEETP